MTLLGGVPDLCVVGAGPAGLSLALRLSQCGLRVVLLESGGMTLCDENRTLSTGVADDEDYPFTTSRARAFGGSAAIWYGACIEFEPDDVDRRSWIAGSGWPITYSEITGNYKSARRFFSLPEPGDFEKRLEKSRFHGDGLSARSLSFGKTVNLGKLCRDRIQRDPGIACLLQATVTSINASTCGQHIQSLTFRLQDGSTHVLRAGAFVLACGGIENARLLLASRDRHSRGLGNAHDVVGRYHMEHPMRSVGILPVPRGGRDLAVFTNATRVSGGSFQATFGLSKATRARAGLLNLHLRCYRYHPLEATLSVIAGKQALTELGQGRLPPEGFAGLISAASPRSARYLAWHCWNKSFRNARFDYLRFVAFLEQEPDPENRITLASERDDYSIPLPRLFWRESDRMRASVAKSLSLLDAAFKRRGLPGLVTDRASIEHLDGYGGYGFHHMGSTRMSHSPRFGVVDRDCRVFGLSNLFVAGSSVFPTGGAANPTLTIVALAERLALHLTDRARAGQLAHPSHAA